MQCHSRNVVAGFAMLVLAFVAVGCQSKGPTFRSGYDQVRQGSTSEGDVVAILGEPDHKLPGLWIYQRPEDHLYVKIEFDDAGRVTRKEWIDGVTGDWEDTQDARRAQP